MDSNKIAVIVSHPIGSHASSTMATVADLECPEGFHVDVIEIFDAVSTAAAYNEGMRSSDAKYKIYIRDGCRILRFDILREVISVFQSNPLIGILGTSGTKSIPTDALCLNSGRRIGQVHRGKSGEKNAGLQITDPYTTVMAVDPYFIATQYDIPWREDLFRGDCFWETAQCMEFKRKGYHAAVIGYPFASVEVPSDDYDWTPSDQAIFLDEYSGDIYPLVSIIIPTYNRPRYFQEALESVLRQTYRNLDIFITDDSDNTLTKELIQPYLERDNRITYEYHPGIGAEGNWENAMAYDHPDAQYVNWLMDDDLFHTNKISKMMNFFLEQDGLSLVTSYRQLIDGEGDPLPDIDATKPICEKDTRFSGESIGKALLESGLNFIGELSTVLFRKDCLKDHRLGWTGQEGKYLVPDFPVWLQLLTKGDMFYIREPLSCFRSHDGNSGNDIRNLTAVQIGFGLELRYAWENRIFLTDAVSYETAILSWMQEMAVCFYQAKEQGLVYPDLDVLAQQGIRFLEDLRNCLRNGAALS